MRSLVVSACIAAFTLVGCGSDAPVGQIRVFNDAFRAANAAGQPLIDDLALAERHVGQTTAEARAQGESAPDAAGEAKDAGCPQAKVNWQVVSEDVGFIRGFCLSDATYFATVSDPPGAHSVRVAMDVISRYADVLLLLAEGRNIEEVQGQIKALANNVASFAAFIPGAQPYVAAIGPILDQLKPLIAAAAQAQNDKEVLRLLNEGAPKVSALIDALKDSAGAMFLNLTYASAEHALSPEALDHPAVAKADIARIEGYRTGVANYVVLLDALKVSLDEAVEAANAPPNSITLASLAERSAQLSAQAEAVRHAWSVLRSGVSGNN